MPFEKMFKGSLTFSIFSHLIEINSQIICRLFSPEIFTKCLVEIFNTLGVIMLFMIAKSYIII